MRSDGGDPRLLVSNAVRDHKSLIVRVPREARGKLDNLVMEHEWQADKLDQARVLEKHEPVLIVALLVVRPLPCFVHQRKPAAEERDNLRPAAELIDGKGKRYLGDKLTVIIHHFIHMIRKLNGASTYPGGPILFVFAHRGLIHLVPLNDVRLLGAAVNLRKHLLAPSLAVQLAHGRGSPQVSFELEQAHVLEADHQGVFRFWHKRRKDFAHSLNFKVFAKFG